MFLLFTILSLILTTKLPLNFSLQFKLIESLKWKLLIFIFETSSILILEVSRPFLGI